jgi:hypothetical protein
MACEGARLSKCFAFRRGILPAFHFRKYDDNISGNGIRVADGKEQNACLTNAFTLA